MRYIESEGRHTNEDGSENMDFWRVEYIPDMDSFRVDIGIRYWYIKRADLLATRST